MKLRDALSYEVGIKLLVSPQLIFTHGNFKVAVFAKEDPGLIFNDKPGI